MIAKYPRAALLIESSRGYGRGLLRGIADYVRVHGQGERTTDRPDYWCSVAGVKG